LISGCEKNAEKTGVGGFRNYIITSRRIIRGKAGAASALDASQDKYQFYDVGGYAMLSRLLDQPRMLPADPPQFAADSIYRGRILIFNSKTLTVLCVKQMHAMHKIFFHKNII